MQKVEASVFMGDGTTVNMEVSGMEITDGLSASGTGRVFTAWDIDELGTKTRLEAMYLPDNYPNQVMWSEE